MKTALSQAQIRHYRREGFVTLPNLLSPAEVRELKAAVAKGVQAMGKLKVAGGGKEWEDDDSYYSRVFLQRLNLWKESPTVRKFMLNPALGKMLARLAGVNRLRVWHDQTLQKAPWANATSWHQDVPYWSFTSKDALSIWIALDDATLQNGGLYFLPGTHRKQDYRAIPIGPDMEGLFKLHPKWRKIEPVPVPLKAGSASVHNGLLAHSAGPNMTPRWRRAMTCAYMPDGCVFNGKKNILSKEQVSRLKVGDPLNDEVQNPLV